MNARWAHPAGTALSVAALLSYLFSSPAMAKLVGGKVEHRSAADPAKAIAEVARTPRFSTPELLALLKESRDREVQRQALFWLGQSDDPRAVAELERLLTR